MASPRRLTPGEREAALGVLTILLDITTGCHPRLVRHIRGAYDSIRHSGERDQAWLDRNYEATA